MRSAYSLLAAAAFSLATDQSAMSQDVHPSGHSHAKAPALGTIVFPNSGNAAAQPAFLKGVALLHSFEYEQAADAFRLAQKADPSLALAYWGEALTYSHVVWRYEDLDASRAALQRLGPTAVERLAKAKTARERSFGAAVESFYADGSLPQRIHAYANAMRRHAADAPDDQEAAAFASHALMLAGYATSGAARDTMFREAIALAQRVVTANANHPGGTHYLIHLYDSPRMAQQGLAFARAYDKIAPDAEHALHMPSHIYLQLGMWDDVVRSNERAWAASRADASGPGDADWHAFSWLHYAYLQQGRTRAAQALLDSAQAILAGVNEGYIDARFAQTRLQFQQNAETGRWSSPLPPAPPLSPGASDRERGFRQQANYWMVISAGMRGDSAELARLSGPYLAIADSVIAGAVVPPVRAGNALVVRALVAESRRDSAGSLAAWRSAVEAEKKLDAFVGPPERVFAAELWMRSILGPASHTNGLTPARRALIAEALPAVENVLRLCPQRSETLHILATVGDLVGPSSLRHDAFSRLGANYKNADAERKSLLPPTYR